MNSPTIEDKKNKDNDVNDQKGNMKQQCDKEKSDQHELISYSYLSIE